MFEILTNSALLLISLFKRRVMVRRILRRATATHLQAAAVEFVGDPAG